MMMWQAQWQLLGPQVLGDGRNYFETYTKAVNEMRHKFHESEDSTTEDSSEEIMTEIEPMPITTKAVYASQDLATFLMVLAIQYGYECEHINLLPMRSQEKDPEQQNLQFNLPMSAQDFVAAQVLLHFVTYSVPQKMCSTSLRLYVSTRGLRSTTLSKLSDSELVLCFQHYLK